MWIWKPSHILEIELGVKKFCKTAEVPMERAPSYAHCQGLNVFEAPASRAQSASLASFVGGLRQMFRQHMRRVE